MAATCLMGGFRVQGGYFGQRDDSHPSGLEQDGSRFHDATQSSMQFKIYELFISGIFLLNLLGPQLTASNCGYMRLWKARPWIRRELLCIAHSPFYPSIRVPAITFAYTSD